MNRDGTPEAALVPAATLVNELPPAGIATLQVPTVHAGRPRRPCDTPFFPRNYGTVLAVLFSKPMQQSLVNVPSAYVLDNGNPAGSVQIQPGGRVALLNLRRPVSAIRPRTMTVSGIADARGNALPAVAQAVQSSLTSGIALRGRVARADGSPAVGVPVTLTRYDQETGFDCQPFTVRPSQVFTDNDGYFAIDYVMSGGSYSGSVTDISGLSGDALQIILDSAAGDAFNRAKLLELANSAAAQNSLRAAFAVGALPEAITKAEGLDRAWLRDFVAVGTPREGTVGPVALRFRGRGVVTGQVVASDGVTAVNRAAVNLFPDPDSRELGRGLFTGSDGRFAFFGVPLGEFSIQADNSTGLTRTVAGVSDRPGQTNNLLVVLGSAIVPRTELAGRVVEADNATPHAGATVFVGRYSPESGKFENVVAVVTADSSGFWRAAGIPAKLYDVIGVSLDGKRKGERRDVTAPFGVTNQISIALQGFGVVVGRVETATGVRVANALVAGGERLVRTDNAGTFRLTGVPTGPRSINAGVERSVPGEPAKSTPAFSFPRLGGAAVNVLPGVENFAVIRFEPRGSIIGGVRDETGTNRVTGINVAKPVNGGFLWVPVNAQGEFAFEGLELGDHTFSAPGPAVANTDVSGLLQTIASGSAGEIQAAIGEAFASFTGAADPLLNGAGATCNPNRWGFLQTALTADGEVRNLTIQFLRASTISGTVRNGQGVPIGARVRLTGIGPLRNGAPGTPPRVLYVPLGVASTNQLRYRVNDGFADSAEASSTLVSTNNPAADADGDGLPDGYELANGLNPFVNDAALDPDSDGLTSLQEFNRGTALNRRDTDNDGLNDGAEVALGTNPLNPDTDGDGILEGVDPNPFTSNADFDGDGIPDVDDLDIDGDGISNADELRLGTDPRNPDTDGDGWRDGVELEAGSIPMLASSVPVLFVVAQNEVGLILPAAGDLAEVASGVTVAQPEVGLRFLLGPGGGSVPGVGGGVTNDGTGCGTARAGDDVRGRSLERRARMGRPGHRQLSHGSQHRPANLVAGADGNPVRAGRRLPRPLRGDAARGHLLPPAPPALTRPETLYSDSTTAKLMKPQSLRSHWAARRVALGALFVTALGLTAALHAQNFDAGSDGSLGDVIIATDTTLDLPPDGKLHFRNLTVNGGTTLRFNRNARNTPVFILSRSNVVVDGTISVDGGDRSANTGGAAGPGGFAGGKPGSGADSPPGFGYGPGGGAPGGGDNCTPGPNVSTGGSYGALGHGAANAVHGNTLLIPMLGGSGGEVARALWRGAAAAAGRC